MEQCILTLAKSWWQKASDNNDNIASFTYHHQKNNVTKKPLNIITKVISSSKFINPLINPLID